MSRSDTAVTGPAPGASEHSEDPGPGDARTDSVEESTFLVVGGGQAGRLLAERLAPRRAVHHLDTEATAVADPTDHEASHVSELARRSALATTGVTGDDIAFVLTGDDGRNLLVTQLLRTAFGVDRIYVVLADPRNRDAFDIAGVETVCAAGVLSDAVLGIALGAEATGSDASSSHGAGSTASGADGATSTGSGADGATSPVVVDDDGGRRAPGA